MNKKHISSFEQLDVWQATQDLAVNIYKITRKFPPEELYGIVNQIRRSSSSISANIAEGFGRRTVKDKLQFYTIAYGSLLETKNFLYLSHKLDYIDKDILNNLINRSIMCQKLLNAFMAAHK